MINSILSPKNTVKKHLFLLTFLCTFFATKADIYLRINQLGYLPTDSKVAVCLSNEKIENPTVELFSALTGKKIDYKLKVESCGEFYQFGSTFRLNFSDFTHEGSFFLSVNGTKSPNFRIATDVYNGAADFLLNYMRQQRCGYNPSLDQICHQHDGYEVMGVPNEKSTKKVDARGGWHDASDYLQYTTTSANAIYQLLFAYKNNPHAFGDKYGADGKLGANGIPDILDEARWGLEWLCRMNPEKEVYYNQIADDRDHASFRLPSEDFVDYGWGEGKGRPVYLVSNEPQGLLKYKNRSNGKASTVGKFASSFSLGAQLLAQFDNAFAEKLAEKAKDAFEYGLKFPGVSQTAPGRSPYFYEEDNWTDDMELAAITLFDQTKDEKYLKHAVAFGRMEPFTPWMGSDTARHYQWYPFVNLGHFDIVKNGNAKVQKEFITNTRNAIERVQLRANENPFRNGVPFIWCSNNLVTAMATHCHLYRAITSDNQFLEMETSLRDWLFGCNPWGTSMVVGLPSYGDTPHDPHSALWVNHKIAVNGGLVDGPVYGAIFNGLWGVHLSQEDEYAKFQSDWAFYHDDWSDYSSNEPTMDGTASLTYYLSSLAEKNEQKPDKNIYSHGGIVRTNPDKKQISLVFTGHEFSDGFNSITKTLAKHNIKGAFFFTGDFYRNPKHKKMLTQLVENEHYIGAHSDRHLLYAAWGKRDSTLVSYSDFVTDIQGNYAEISKFQPKIDKINLFLPPFEYYNDTISTWAQSLGLQIVNFTAGTRTNGDYTIPEMKNYYSSDFIVQSVLDEEAKNGLNGHIMLVHFGTDPRRTDKFYNHLDELITTLKSKGYEFVKLTEAMNN